MRIVLIGLVALAAAVLSACAQKPIEQQLAWVEHADPAKMLADSMRAGRVHFLTVCGFACGEPAVGFATYAHCYARVAGKLTIDPTGDLIQSKREDELKEKLFVFAKQYNTLLRAELDRTGRRQCPGGERWDAYFQALDSLARQVPAHPYVSFVLALKDVGGDRPDFQLHIQNERDLSPEIYQRACALAPRFGIVGRVRFTVTTGDINDHPKKQPGFSCSRGVVVR